MSDVVNESYLKDPKGLRSWLFTLDHKRIGIMYLCAIMLFFFIGGMLAVMIRLELFHPGEDFMDADAYNQMFTLHGAIMIFLFIIPAIPAALGNFVLPLMLGAKDVAFPRMNLASFYIYVSGALFAVYSILTGAVDTGWTFFNRHDFTGWKIGRADWITASLKIIEFPSTLAEFHHQLTIQRVLLKLECTEIGNGKRVIRCFTEIENAAA